MRMILSVLCSILTLFSPVYGGEFKHPLVKPYQGAEESNSKYFNYFESNFPLTRFDDNEFEKAKSRLVKGRHYFTRYKVPGASALEVYKNFLNGFKQQGLTIEFTCAPGECGRYVETYLEYHSALEVLRPILNDKTSFIVANLTKESSKVSVLMAVSDSLNPVNFYQVVVEEYQPKFDRVTLDKAAYEQYLIAAKTEQPVLKSDKKDIEGAVDHPLISRYLGAALIDYATFGYEEVALPTAPVESKDPEQTLLVKGQAQFYRYSTARGVALVEVVKSYQRAFNSDEFEVIFQCERGQCGRYIEHYLESDQVFKGVRTEIMRETPLFVARHRSKYGSTLVLVSFYDWSDYVSIYQAVIKESILDDTKVAINSDYIADQIMANGKVALYGIHFEHDSDTITPESQAPLSAIADFLEKNTNLSLYVVGHTDASGTEAYNQALSLKRATAITEKLVKEFGVKRSRLTPKGVGNLVPVASNKQNDGKRLNRRVELVEKL
ncbi:OmpA family protein [Pleionea litopenaei]|uniref:OmpA family protein n=1 Tax=Pleionea litopenaei TaxID=3070815 RepID=A0AA51X7L5_9GAMM|nr:OmpA family protein [Pleionea sp. HL-JVS1]WMS87235.1 OmpA family protein [Pleionea sp. HL-JVS1]